MSMMAISSPSPAEILSRSTAATATLGRTIGRRIDAGMTLFLIGELGSGKTAFAQGLARGLDIPEEQPVTSPTYTLINAYTGRLPFYHVDLYRLPAPVDPDEIGLLELFDADAVVAVEWPERLHPADRPSQRIEVHFTVTGDDSRRVRIFAYGLDPADLLKDIGV